MIKIYKGLSMLVFLFIMGSASFCKADITWCNLQWPASGTINLGGSFDVYAQVYAPGVTNVVGQGTGIQGWIGYSSTNTDPSTWTNWVPLTFNVDVGNNDEFKATFGNALPAGTYYYASRFQLNSGTYYYGGFSSGFWNGTTNVSGVLTVTNLTGILWCNLQWPATDTIVPGDSILVYARVYANGITDTIGQGAGIQAWIGYDTANTNPNTWTKWIPATYNLDVVNNDEYKVYIGDSLPAGKYYYASRFQLGNGSYNYGGYQFGSGGFWNGTANVSGELTVSNISWCNLQSPATATINMGDPLDVYARVYAQGITDLSGQGTGIRAWIGYSTTNTNPNTWTSWIPAAFNTDVANNDEYKLNLTNSLCGGTYYLASRFQAGNGAYYYGGYNTGYWNGTTNVSGIVTVAGGSSDITWCNVHSPGTGNIDMGDSIKVLARVFAPCLTSAAGPNANIQAWIGYNNANTNPATWTNWKIATFDSDVSIYDQYQAFIGGSLAAGTYYYASRFKLDNGAYHYGGFSTGEWNNTTNVSGILSIIDTTDDNGIQETETANLEIYPNPATDILTVRLNSTNGDVLLNIFNIFGKTVMTDVLNSSAITQKTYQISNLPKGIYILEAKIHNATYTKKLTIF